MEIWGKVLPFVLLLGLALGGYQVYASEQIDPHRNGYVYCSMRIGGVCDDAIALQQ